MTEVKKLKCVVKPTLSPIGFHDFVARSDKPITEEEARKAQKAKGYHPQGYGFYAFQTVQEGDSYRATWKCSNNCE